MICMTLKAVYPFDMEQIIVCKRKTGLFHLTLMDKRRAFRQMELCAPLRTIGSILLAALFLHTLRTDGFHFRSVDERCIPTCFMIYNNPNWTFKCDGDNSTCDWQCAAQRMGCDEGLVYHCAQDYENQEFKRNKIEYIEACAPERFCRAGEQPSVTFAFDDVVRSLRNAKINCIACTDSIFYNSEDRKSSASYSRCYHQKFNKCIPEDHKINCGEMSWLNRKETDGYCRCDARNGYAPENENVKTKCFYSYEFCILKRCPQPAEELLLNYTCGDRCPPAMHRTEESDECVPDKKYQTTTETVTPTKGTVIPLSKEKEKTVHFGITTQAHTDFPNEGHKEIRSIITYRFNTTAAIITVFISVIGITGIALVCYKFNGKQKVKYVYNYVTNHIAGHNIVNRGREYQNHLSSPNDPGVHHSEDGPSDGIEMQELIASTENNSIGRPSQNARSGHEVSDDPQEHLLLIPRPQNEEARPDNTTTVTIEAEDEHSLSGSYHSQCDNPGSEACEVSPNNTPEDETVPLRPVFKEKFSAKLLSSKNNPLPSDRVDFKRGATLCSNVYDKTMEDTITHGQETHVQNNEGNDTKKTSHINENGQLPSCSKIKDSELVSELNISQNGKQAPRKHTVNGVVNGL